MKVICIPEVGNPKIATLPDGVTITSGFNKWLSAHLEDLPEHSTLLGHKHKDVTYVLWSGDHARGKRKSFNKTATDIVKYMRDMFLVYTTSSLDIYGPAVLMVDAIEIEGSISANNYEDIRNTIRSKKARRIPQDIRIYISEREESEKNYDYGGDASFKAFIELMREEETPDHYGKIVH